MSDLLLHWLNNDLELSTPIANVEDDFASGYLFGELLHRLNQQHNFSDFMNRDIADAKIINFCLFEPTLRRLNVAFDSKIATAIMNKQRGAAANLLYQIKMATERLARAPAVSTRSDERRNVRPLHNIPPKLSKPAYDAAHHYFFEHSVRRQVKSLGELKRERDAIQAEIQTMHAYRASQAAIQVQLESTRAERLHQAFLHSQYIKTALDETDSPAWRLALEKKRERERRKALFYQQLLAAKTQRQQTEMFSLRHTVEKDLDEFEQRESVTLTGNGKRPSRKSLGYGLRSLSTALEHQSALQGPGLRDPTKPIPLGEPTPEHQSHTSTIREQKQHRERRRDQFNRRRKRFLQEALHFQSHINVACMASDLERLVTRGTHHEGESKQAMAKILIYKEIVTENRRRRQERYATRREMDLQDAVDRDTAVYELLFAKYNDDWELQGHQQHHRITARTAAQQHENALVAGFVLHELISFAMMIAGKREDSMLAREPTAFLLTDEEWTELRFQFAEHGLLFLEESTNTDNLVQHQLIEYLDRFLPPTFLSHEYVDAVMKGSRTSPWVPFNRKFIAAVEILEDRIILGETIKYVRWLAHADTRPQTQEAVNNGPPTSVEVAEEPLIVPDETSAVETASGEAVIDALQEPELPQVLNDSASEAQSEYRSPRLCILFAGPPFAGKTTQAKLLAEKYDLALLSVERHLELVLTEASELATEAQRRLVQGEQLPPQLYSGLVLDAIERLDRRHRDRWILYDLPSTQAHAQSLEEHLSGFIEPKQVPSPFDHESLLAPGTIRPKLPPSFLHGKSGLDLVFYLECAESSALERCLGTLEDCETHEQTCHLLFAPPVQDATDRFRLKHVNRTTNTSALLSLQCLSIRDFASDAKSWFTRFDTLRDLATTESQEGQNVAVMRVLTEEATHTRLVGYVEAFFDQQRNAEAEQVRENECQEAVATQEEEHRQLKLAELKLCVHQAQEEVAKAQLAVQQAEEAKAKKDEIAELRAAIEPAKKRVEQALMDARDWRMDEALRVADARSIYSGLLVPSLAQVLASIWGGIECEYTQVMHQCLQMQRQERDRVEQRALWVIATVCRFLRRIDTKQTIVNTFQVQFNEVVDEMRFDDTTKAELHARTDVLQDELRLVTTNKQTTSHDELRELLTDGWLEDTCQRIALTFQRMLQAECDRFRVSLELLVDALGAASAEPAQLAGVVDTLRAHPQLLADLTLKTFVDASEEQVAVVPIATTSTAPTGKAPVKGGAAVKGKPPLAPQPTISSIETPADPLATETLLLAYDAVLQKSEALIELITNAPKHEDPKPHEPVAPPPVTHTKPGKTGTTPAATPTATPVSSMVLLPRQSIDVATSNFHKAITYEHDLFMRRVRYLKDAVQRECEHVGRAMRTVETKLRVAIDQRAVREEAAIAALVVHVRTAIEAETNLPFYLHIQPNQVYRFPITEHLIEDTRVTIDTRQRLVARVPLEPPPEIEMTDEIVLNPRQATVLQHRLSLDNETPPSLTIVDVVSILHTLATEPHTLPLRWQNADEATLVQIVAEFMHPESGLVDTHALVQAMTQGPPSLVSMLYDPLNTA